MLASVSHAERVTIVLRQDLLNHLVNVVLDTIASKELRHRFPN